MGMSFLRSLTLLLYGRAAIVSTEPVDLVTERVEVNATWNRETGEGRVITNMSRRVAVEVHVDLLRVEGAQPSTETVTGLLGAALYGQARGNA